MAHCAIEDLADLSAELEQVRGWPDIRERSPGVFYVRSTPFLHFHHKDGARWADARCGKAWGPKLEIPFRASTASRRKFLAAVRRSFLRTRSGEGR